MVLTLACMRSCHELLLIGLISDLLRASRYQDWWSFLQGRCYRLLNTCTAIGRRLHRPPAQRVLGGAVLPNAFAQALTGSQIHPSSSGLSSGASGCEGSR